MKGRGAVYFPPRPLHGHPSLAGGERVSSWRRSKAMDFGFNLPTRGPLANRESMLALAKRGEQLGYTYLALPDHIVIPRTIGSPYPYSASRKMGAVGEGDCMEELTVM